MESNLSQYLKERTKVISTNHICLWDFSKTLRVSGTCSLTISAYKGLGVVLALRLSPEERVGCECCSRGFWAGKSELSGEGMELSLQGHSVWKCAVRRGNSHNHRTWAEPFPSTKVLTLKPYNNIRLVCVFSHTLCLYGLDDLYCEKDWTEYHSHFSTLWHWVENI